MSQKEIKIKKSALINLAKDLFLAFGIIIPLLLLIQHFGEVRSTKYEGYTGIGFYKYSSPINLNAYDSTGKYFDSAPNYFQRLWNFYLLSIFSKDRLWLFLPSILIFTFLQLFRLFKKHYKIKIV